jgi:hypothetical protein
MKITTILMYCSNDFRWIERCVEQASKISEEIIVKSRVPVMKIGITPSYVYVHTA